MKKTFILCFVVLSSIMWTNAQKPTQYEDFFTEFILRFSADSLFQLDRVKFPLIFQTVNCENGVDEEISVKIDRKDYRTVTLINPNCLVTTYNIVSDNLKFDFVKTKIFVLNVIGIDNDQFDRYVFENINGRWFLIRIISNDNWLADVN